MPFLRGQLTGRRLQSPKSQGSITVGDIVLGQNLVLGTRVLALGTGTGGVGTYTVSIPQNVIVQTMSTGVEVIAAQDNRVSEPKCPDFVTMTPIIFTRLSTNVDTYADVFFTGSISGEKR